jgi:hypothetical protein
MHTKYKNIALLLFFLLISNVINAQNRWQTKGTLYSDKNISVEIEYLISPDGCAEANSSSYFRYRITRIGARRNYYVNWRFDYFNCDNELKTQLNSLHILKSSEIGVVTPELNSFSAKRMSNYLNDVKISTDLPATGTYKPISIISMEPVAISGLKDILSGESTTLKILGGSLGIDAVWTWYEGSCGGTLLGTGPSITITPDHTTSIFVRATGSKPSPCLSTNITVKEGSIPAKSITGPNEICEGERNITLAVSGGKLFGQAKWVWYSGSCGATKIGEGKSIVVSPDKSTTYFVRAEDGQDHTICQSLNLVVKNKSVNPLSIQGLRVLNYGAETKLNLVSGYLSPGSKWVWYKGSGTNLQAIGSGTSVSTGYLYSNEVFSVRAEGDCNQTELVSMSILVTNAPKQKASKGEANRSSFLINGGSVFSETADIGKLDNYIITIGGGGRLGWFARAKVTAHKTGATYQTTDVAITNYNIPGFYSYNGEKISKRSAYTAGIFFGGYHLSGYVGGGYGTRDLLWGINQYSYDGISSYSVSHAKNTENSFKGAEIELGLLVRFGFFNLMGGASSIQGKYTDFNIGLGFNL